MQLMFNIYRLLEMVPIHKSCFSCFQSNKPIMEKKRRARINNCLNELKNLLLEAMRKDVSHMRLSTFE